MASTSRRFAPPLCRTGLAREARRAFGVYYTPPEIVELIVDLTLGPLKRCQAPCVLDPACGDGEFLLAVHQHLATRFGRVAAGQSVFGIDIDTAAVASANRRLKAIDRDFPATNIRVADALTDAFAPQNSYDAIVGNPPYVNIRQLSKIYSQNKFDELRQQYRTARGNFDLYVLFIERAIDLLRPGGRCGLILPNKWATLDYARECRHLLLSHTTVEQIIDLSDHRVFSGASVYPHVLVFRKQSPNATHGIRVGALDQRQQTIRQRSLCPDALHLSPVLDIESLVSTAPLGQITRLCCGTTGYAASKVAHRLLDASDESKPADNTADFITSGNISRYAIEIGNVRYLNRDYIRPRLPLDVPEITAAKRRLFTANKIVIAGMSRRLEAAWDERGLALGVQVFAASEFQVDPFYLLALLNSKLLSYLFSTRYAAKRLSGGYLAINKGQLARLPIRTVVNSDQADRKRQRRLSQLAASWTPSRETEIDRHVYQLYCLTNDEISRVESHFSRLTTKAA